MLHKIEPDQLGLGIGPELQNSKLFFSKLIILYKVIQLIPVGQIAKYQNFIIGKIEYCI